MEQGNLARDLRLFVSLPEETSGEWRVGAAWEPDKDSSHGPGTQSWRRALALPNGEVLEFTAVYSAHNNSVGIEAWKEGKMLAQVLAVKSKATSYDPSLILLSPGGTHVEVMVGGSSQ